MENNEQQQPVIDVDYIDKLLSTYPPKTEETVKPAEAAPAVETPAAEAPLPEEPLPEKKGSTKPLLILAAIALLGVGFLLGWLAKPTPKLPPEGTTSTAPTYLTGTLMTGPGIAVDYASMSTKQLTDIAIQIPELKAYGNLAVSLRLTPDIYEELKRKNPVLIELEQRSDAVEQLTFYNLISSSSLGNPAATALIEYYVGYLGFDRYPYELTPDCEWVVQNSELFTVYEYTQAPSVYFTIDEGSSGATTVFSFGGCKFYLRGDPNVHADNANFWYRIELTPNGFDDGFASVPDPEPELTWITTGSSAWVTWQKSDQGWFIYGYAPSKTDLTFTVYPSGNEHKIQLSVSPVPNNGEDPAVFAQCVLDQALTLQVLSQLNPDKDLATYPIVAAVLEQPGGISALLNLAQTSRKRLDSPVISSIIYYNPLVPLLSTSAFTDRMTTNEALALQLLRGDSNVYLDLYDPLNPTVMETPEGLVLKELPQLRVGDKPEALRDIPVSEMDYWVYAPLTEAATILRQPNWELNVIIAPGAEGLFGTWPVYDGEDSLVGWIVSGKQENHDSLLLGLMQGDSSIASQNLDIQDP